MITGAAWVLFLAGVAWLAYLYFGYPLLLWILGYLRRRRHTLADDFLPSVSVLISARNEEKDIAWKVQQTLEWDYPPDRLEVLVASDASEDETDAILESIHSARLKYLRMDKRVGKALALNRLYELAQGELLLFTDANSDVPAACLRRMVRHFADERVGCVTGIERTIRDEQESALAVGGSAYLGYESRINGLESRLGSVLVCDGSLYCIRRSLFWPLQADLHNDLEQPLRIGAAGYWILYEPEAFSQEKPTSSPRQEFGRRCRICGTGIVGMWRLRNCLRGMRLWQFVSRKLLRWFTLMPLLMILVGSALLTTPLFRFVLVLQAMFYGLALLGWFFASRGKEGTVLVNLPFYFMLANVAAFTGIVQGLMGKRFNVWEIATLSRGTRSATAHVSKTD